MVARISNIPLEDHEQIAFVEWLELNSLKFTAIPNSTYTKSWSQKMKNKRLGLRPGLLDILVLVSKEQSKDGEGYALFIEMKRQKGGVVSEVQQEWIDALNLLGTPHVQAYVAKGCDEAISIVSHYLKVINKSLF